MMLILNIYTLLYIVHIIFKYEDSNRLKLKAREKLHRVNSSLKKTGVAVCVRQADFRTRNVSRDRDIFHGDKRINHQDNITVQNMQNIYALNNRVSKQTVM